MDFFFVGVIWHIFPFLIDADKVTANAYILERKNSRKPLRQAHSVLWLYINNETYVRANDASRIPQGKPYRRNISHASSGRTMNLNINEYTNSININAYIERSIYTWYCKDFDVFSSLLGGWCGANVVKICSLREPLPIDYGRSQRITNSAVCLRNISYIMTLFMQLCLKGF